ncbi:MAG TPA: Gfo/Idh/MocA family oxidoreductase [Chromatiaceae bacterium]|jgi:predicted dehydrogenase|nr:Gfo/Idh/MocA family oxidoreductase [Chromatiaceae bacterium]HIN81721.1 Gfo/Idh/MocA family oxidoreductase [Chromatiales bacterium]HIA07836.1 Gfo/Idh/MocA family oxidoreductase [Chromatiaceae bacterium]HIB84472.1 Gfo/Idh/MocA family oxidoreductase [Chromatiaceae bacterium]HIO14881.1 Gfo/Idh/MocA family oxidoreductase [Chromatiales bacterium]
MRDTVRVGVVGVGYLGRFHAQIYSRLEAAELVGVVDVDADTARTVADDCGCEVFASAESLIERVDAVSIVVPTSLHCEVAEPFIDAGIHILMEKPIAPGYEESAALVARAEAAGVVFQVGHLERFNAGVKMLAERSVNPRFIEAHRMSPFVARATDVDVVTDLMIHDIDIALSLIDSPVKSVSAIGIPVLTRHADIANARIEFENGAVANITASRVSDQKFRRIRVFGDNRYEALNFVDQQIESLKAVPADDGEWPEVEHDKIAVDAEMPLDKELEAFLDSVINGNSPLVDGHVALQALAVAMRVKEEIAK